MQTLEQMDSGLNPTQTQADLRADAEREQEGRRRLRERSREWETEHEDRVGKLEREMAADAEVGRDHALLLHLTAHEAALAERIYDAQVQLVERVAMLVDNPTHAATLTRALRDTVAVSGAISGRIESLLGTAAVLRAQRELNTAKRRNLRAVA